MTRSKRLLYRDVPNGRHRKTFRPLINNQNSAVVVTAAEWIVNRTFMLDESPDIQDGRPHLGDATVYVTNVGPQDPQGEGDLQLAAEVEFYLHVEGAVSPIPVIVTISVLEDIENPPFEDQG